MLFTKTGEFEQPGFSSEPQPGTSKEEPDFSSEPQPGTSTQGPDFSLQPGTSQRPPAFEVPPLVSPPLLSPVMLEAENYFFKQDLAEKDYKLQHLNNRLSFESIKDNTELILLYTGLPNAIIFNSVYELIKDLNIQYYLKWKVEKISVQNQLLLTMMKLRQNFPHIDLAHRFQISQAAVSNIVITWIHELHKVLYVKFMNKILSRRQNRSCLPNCFSTFTNCRIIIDCTEIFTSVPRQSMATQRSTFSSYKHRNTWKGLNRYSK